MARRLVAGFLVAVLAAVFLSLLLWCSLLPPRLLVPATGVELKGVTVVNPGAARLSGQTVVVRGDRIERIDPTPPAVPAGPHTGSFVLPGLIDLHVHHPPAFAVGERDLFALLFLASGITSVRDVGSALPGTLRDQAAAIAAGRRAGPRLFQCGPFLDGPSPAWPGAQVVESPEEAHAAVGAIAADGADCVKIYNGLGRATLRAILEAAGAHHLPVVAHVPWAASLSDLPGAEVQHLMGLTWEWDHVGPDEIARYVHQSRALGIRHVPTLVTFAHAAALAQGEMATAARRLPRYHRDILWRIERNPLARAMATTDARLRAMKAVVRALHEAGVPVLAGTDTLNPQVVPGVALHEELNHLVDAGLSPEETWIAATRLAAEALGQPELGRLALGAPADFLVFDEDPTRDLRALATLRLVVARGRPYPRETLEGAVTRALAHFEGFPYEPLSMAAASLALSWLGSDEGGG